MESGEAEQLNQALLATEVPTPSPPEEPKRNSKQALIDKILEISERDGIPITPIPN